MTQSRVLDVLLVSQPTSGGVAVCVRQLAEAGVRTGHQVTIACPSETSGPLADWIKQAGATHVPLEMTRQPGLKDLKNLFAIRKLIRNRDIVHLHSSKAGALGRIATIGLRRARPPVVFTPHAWSWLVGGRLAPIYRFVERILAVRSDRIVAVSRAEAEDGRSVIGGSRADIDVIVNGVDRSRFSPDGPATSRVEGQMSILCVGRLSEQKGQDLLLRSFAALDHPRVQLRLVGSGPEEANLRLLANDLGVADKVTWVAHQDDPVLEYRTADIVVAPSRWDGMSLVLLEAMASGCAIVATAVLGSEALGEAGLIVEIDNQQELTREISTLLSDEGLRMKLGEAARSRSAEYDLATTLRQNLDLWSTLAGT